MIDNNIFISSATLIPDMYNDYNIQSDDFVSRFPIWVANALEELKFIQAYVNVEKDIEVYFDKEIISEKKMTFHPNTNEKTIFLDTTDLLKFIEEIGYTVNIIDL